MDAVFADFRTISWRGDEFVAFLLGTDLDGAQAAGERLRRDSCVVLWERAGSRS